MRWLLIGLLSFIVAIALPCKTALPPSLANTPISTTRLAPTVLPTVLPTVSSADNTPQTLLRQGLAHYEEKQFTEAVQQWQQASQAFSRQGDRWAHALTLSYTALAYLELGQPTLAKASLDESFQQLEPIDPSSQSSGQAAIYAKVLNVEGKRLWLEGELEAALSTWQNSAQAYQQAKDPAGMAIAQINQAQVLQHLGLTAQAKRLLQQVYQYIQQQPNAELKAAGLQHLSSALRQMGDLGTAQNLLQERLPLTVQPEHTSLIFLELGNTHLAMADRLSAVGRSVEAQQHLHSAQAAYQQAIEINDTLPAQLNLFRLQINQQQIPEALQQLPKLQESIDQLPPSRTAIYSTIHLTESLLRLMATDHRHVRTITPTEIAARLTIAVEQARTLQDQRAEAYALGQLGHMYEQHRQWREAQSLTEQALLQLESIQAPEIRYRWEWQLGRLHHQQGDQQGAIRAYKSSVESLQHVRNDLLSVNTDIQFSFRDNVEPVYRQYIEQLLASENTVPPRSQQLEQAIATVDQLQLAELENYLGCNLTQQQLIEQAQDPKTAIIYPIVMSDRIAIISQLPGSTGALTYHETSLPQATAEATVANLQANLSTPGRTPEVLDNAHKVYDWLIRPLETDLAQSSAQTLVFVLDGALRNVPLSVLHDGEQYLIEKGYAVAIAPRLQMFSPSASRTPLKVTVGGIGIPQVIDATTFPPIAKLQEELEGIAQYADVSDLLINESFTTDNIRQQLQTGKFSAIHWKTHGVFSSDPQETYVVAYNEQIVARDLNDLIWLGSRGGTQPLELMVLSACETAQGDNRAVLGLAGLAARTGTRSVLSTLWIAQDTPNTEFMVQFYKALAQRGISKAEAVRQAQLTLIHEYGYTTPHIWANYVLVGNWL